ncbi:MAG: sugar ABC transporter substrate-binding protein [Proteobacteria bacterium]|nr:sugar ABC transporter substrate-binding protein [Pseudomonadota bacterium]
MKKLAVASTAALLLAGLPGCKKEQSSGDNHPDKGPTSETSPSSTGSGPAGKSDLRVVVVSHGQASDPFWSVVKNGVDQAAVDTGIKVEYQAPNSFDMVAMGQLIDAAVASKPDGIAVSIPDPKALKKPIQNAISAGIPVVSFNSGSGVAKEYGVIAHVGQTEYEAGYGAGLRMSSAGAKSALCINQEVGNVALDLRCKGFTDAMNKSGGAVEVLAIELADPTESSQRISAALVSKSNVDSMLALGPTGAVPALRALKKDKKLDKIKLATFDLSPEVLVAIRDGEMLFAVDQQQYMQGYLPIVLLKLYLTNLNTLGEGLLRTGPGFVIRENAERVIDLSKKGTR